jgi:hypothetical protein
VPIRPTGWKAETAANRSETSPIPTADSGRCETCCAIPFRSWSPGY